MSIVARFSPKGLTREKYDETLRQLKQTGVKRPRTASSTTFASAREGISL